MFRCVCLTEASLYMLLQCQPCMSVSTMGLTEALGIGHQVEGAFAGKKRLDNWDLDVLQQGYI